MWIAPPDQREWTQIEEATLEEFLGRCDDYRSDSYAGHRSYYFVHNGERFACIHHGTCYARTKFLVPHETV